MTGAGHVDGDAGVAASRLQLPAGHWPTLLDGLCARFPAIPRAQWLDRFARGRVQDRDGRALSATDPYRVGLELRYFREVAGEAPIPFRETVLHADDDLWVVDKPHFLPVVPAGRHIAETLLARLRRASGNADLVPLHRIDRATAGLVLFSASRRTRARYQALFRERAIDKTYEALAPALPDVAFPCVRRSRLARGEPFFRMCEVEGEANTETRVDVIARSEDIWRYRLQPVTGRKHQLRVHMAALGAPIIGDTLYPRLLETDAEDFSHPLKLLARGLAFVDPLTGMRREFTSLREL
ncbi:MAG TPA: pseudouridine synthase [Luteimonas sp.]|nr:pseudouridine synthase [Luteimonas sp.]